jgi:hypothetical protein
MYGEIDRAIEHYERSVAVLRNASPSFLVSPYGLPRHNRASFRRGSAAMARSKYGIASRRRRAS